MNKVSKFKSSKYGHIYDHILVVVGDMEKPSDCKTLVDKVIKHFGQLDIMVN